MVRLGHCRPQSGPLGLHHVSCSLLALLRHSPPNASASQYFWTITGWGDVEAINVSTTQYPVSFLLTGLVALIVQSCYAYRIYIVSGRKLYLPIIIMLLTLAQRELPRLCED
jgi:hypothetical protein